MSDSGALAFPAIRSEADAEKAADAFRLTVLRNNTFCVLATGPGMSTQIADAVRGRCKVIAVSDSYKIARWCDAIASTDAGWWRAHPEALAMPCPKFGAMPDFRAIEGVERLPVDTGTNSGLLGVMVAVKLGAKRVLLCGLDLHSPGDHFFGRHPAPLKSTSAERMDVFNRQFANYRPRGVEILNCTPGSALACYPFADLHESLP